MTTRAPPRLQDGLDVGPGGFARLGAKAASRGIGSPSPVRNEKPDGAGSHSSGWLSSAAVPPGSIVWPASTFNFTGKGPGRPSRPHSCQSLPFSRVRRFTPAHPPKPPPLKITRPCLRKDPCEYLPAQAASSQTLSAIWSLARGTRAPALDCQLIEAAQEQGGVCLLDLQFSEAEEFGPVLHLGDIPVVGRFRFADLPPMERTVPRVYRSSGSHRCRAFVPNLFRRSRSARATRARASLSDRRSGRLAVRNDLPDRLSSSASLPSSLGFSIVEILPVA